MENYKNFEELTVWNNPEFWTDGGHEWSKFFGNTDNLWNTHLFDDLKDFRGKKILEIGPGLGRMTQYLSVLADQLIVVDYNKYCLEELRKKMSHHVLAYFLNDGNSLSDVRNNSQDLVFSFGSFIYMHKNIIFDYLKEIERVLEIGGYGIIHHSNLWGGSEKSFMNNGNRSNMTAELFREYVEQLGMVVVEQKFIQVDQGNPRWNGVDIITTFRKTKFRQL